MTQPHYIPDDNEVEELRRSAAEFFDLRARMEDRFWKAIDPDAFGIGPNFDHDAYAAMLRQVKDHAEDRRYLIFIEAVEDREGGMQIGLLDGIQFEARRRLRAMKEST